MNHLGSIFTVLCFLTFIGICIWAYALRKKEDFSDAADLPFADEELHQKSLNNSINSFSNTDSSKAEKHD